MPVAMTDDQLLAKARDVAHHAYAPYSTFPVGAAILLADGRVFTGCNIENASYNLGTCAERNAAFSMFPHLEPGEIPKIAAVAVVGLKVAPCFPCGGCRQVLREYNCERLIVEDESGRPVSYDFRTEILPNSFGPEDL